MLTFTIGALGMAAAIGLGNGAVFKLVPEYFPNSVGSVTGLVGAAGGLGGFFPPLVLGAVRSHDGRLHAGLRLPRRVLADLPGRSASHQRPRAPGRRNRKLKEASMSVFELEKAEIWINDICKELQIEDEQRAFLALRATLHALRDRLTVQEASHLASQLPMMIRGLFYEGWHPGGRKVRPRGLESFLESVERELSRAAFDPEVVAHAVFRVMARHVSEGQIANVRHALPSKVAELWAPALPLP